jgi:hypothetical protein
MTSVRVLSSTQLNTAPLTPHNMSSTLNYAQSKSRQRTLNAISTWEFLFVGLESDLILGEHVRAIEMKCDSSEPHGLTLGAEKSGS